MKQKTLVVMAAGMGSRFGGLKQIEPVGPNGEFIIDYSVYDAKRAGFSKIVFVIKEELFQTFKETIGMRIEKEIEVSYAFQKLDDIPNKKYLASKREKPWGTLQAVLCARAFVPGDFCVINADDFYGYNSYLKASQFLDQNKNENEYACISYPYIATSSKFGSVKRGVCQIEGDSISKITESKITTMDGYALAESLTDGATTKIALDTPVSMNMFAFKNKFFDYLEEYFVKFFQQDDEVILASEAFLPEVVKEKVQSGEVVLKNIVSTSKWLGITYREDLETLKLSIQSLIDEGEYPKKLWN